MLFNSNPFLYIIIDLLIRKIFLILGGLAIDRFGSFDQLSCPATRFIITYANKAEGFAFGHSHVFEILTMAPGEVAESNFLKILLIKLPILFLLPYAQLLR